MVEARQKQQRKRGIILSDRGWEKLQSAQEDARHRENNGNRFTLALLAEKTGLVSDTLMKVADREEKVDRKTLKQYFQAFGLTLEPQDYYYPDPEDEERVPVDNPPDLPEFPEGQMPLDSPFYLERGTIERDCYREIERPGSLIRIKAPKRTGKTSLVTRILDRAGQLGYPAVYLSLQLADSGLFDDLDRFLRWFCANVTRSLGLKNEIEEYWDDLFGWKMSCKIYFEQYILPALDRPLVIALDDIDRLFQHPHLADDFFSLLRSWHEEGKNKAIWQKLRLIVSHSHSTEVYTPLNINQSPFNVGFPVNLPPFTGDQVEALARRYGVSVDAAGLLEFVGGNPYLTGLALYHVARRDRTLAEILDTPVTDDRNIYHDHLQRQAWNLQNLSPGLRSTWERVVMAGGAIAIDSIDAFHLQSLGFIRFQGNLSQPSCQLYAGYFRDYFQGRAKTSSIGESEPGNPGPTRHHPKSPPNSPPSGYPGEARERKKIGEWKETTA
ncbi:AAA-like domain-containing protein [Pannus brasiliensis CCIBt3594]|uniref:AAA-like domain-containing protein n=1 Tax=Pannus brasiliensis CCIBt3594 TaxID=1427578 RepID=A0AAW9QXW9_9CHRO